MITWSGDPSILIPTNGKCQRDGCHRTVEGTQPFCCFNCCIGCAEGGHCEDCEQREQERRLKDNRDPGKEYCSSMSCRGVETYRKEVVELRKLTREYERIVNATLLYLRNRRVSGERDKANEYLLMLREVIRESSVVDFLE